MDIRWFKGELDKEAKKKAILQHRNAFDDLRAMLEQEINDNAPDYESNSWAYKQADRNGYNRAIRSILKLIDIKEG